MRLHICAIAAAMLAACAPSRAGEREKAWDALIAAAKAHGGVETKMDRSASYVFRQPDGTYIALTRMLKSDKGRSVCLIAQDENATACVDWVTSKLTLGVRPDVATPWRFTPFESLDAFEAAQPTLGDRLNRAIDWILSLSRDYYDDDIIVIRRR